MLCVECIAPSEPVGDCDAVVAHASEVYVTAHGRRARRDVEWANVVAAGGPVHERARGPVASPASLRQPLSCVAVHVPQDVESHFWVCGVGSAASGRDTNVCPASRAPLVLPRNWSSVILPADARSTSRASGLSQQSAHTKNWILHRVQRASACSQDIFQSPRQSLPSHCTGSHTMSLPLRHCGHFAAATDGNLMAAISTSACPIQIERRNSQVIIMDTVGILYAELIVAEEGVGDLLVPIRLVVARQCFELVKEAARGPLGAVRFVAASPAEVATVLKFKLETGHDRLREWADSYGAHAVVAMIDQDDE